MKEVDFKKEKNAYEAKKKYRVQVFFPVTPFVPNEQLRRLYEQGVISWDSYATYALRNTSLPLSDKMKGPPPVDELLFQKPEPKAPKEVKGKVDPEEKEKPDPKVAEKDPKEDKKRKAEDKDKKDSKKAKV